MANYLHHRNPGHFLLSSSWLSKIFELWLLSSFYDFAHIYKYTLKYFTVLRLIWSEISAFHDMTTKYECTSQAAADFGLYTEDFAKF